MPSELVWLVVELDRRYTVERPGDPWEEFYAKAIAVRFGGSDDDVSIGPYDDDRERLRDLIVLADDSQSSSDVENLRFYQRQGFRLRSVERGAFTPVSGYPGGVELDGIPLRDRAWLD